MTPVEKALVEATEELYRKLFHAEKVPIDPKAIIREALAAYRTSKPLPLAAQDWSRNVEKASQAERAQVGEPTDADFKRLWDSCCSYTGAGHEGWCIKQFKNFWDAHAPRRQAQVGEELALQVLKEAREVIVHGLELEHFEGGSTQGWARDVVEQIDDALTAPRRTVLEQVEASWPTKDELSKWVNEYSYSGFTPEEHGTYDWLLAELKRRLG